MSIDPVIAAILTRLGEPPDLAAMNEAAAIEMLRGRVSAESSAGGIPVSHNDTSCVGPNGTVPIRVYRNAVAPQAVIVNMHGGGWVAGSVARDHLRCMAMARAAKANVVSVEYRLAPEHRFPAGLEDAYAATKWAYEKLSSTQGLPLAVSGTSAGANLAAGVAVLARDRGDAAIDFQMLYYPLCDTDFERRSFIENATGYYTTRANLIWYWSQYLGRPLVSPPALAALARLTDFSRLPPAYIATAEHDPLRDEGAEFVARLSAAGVAVSHEDMAGMIHGFLSFAPNHPTARYAMRRGVEALCALRK